MSNSSEKDLEQRDPEVAIEHALSKWEHWTEKNGKKLIYALIAIAVIVGIGFAYVHLYKKPKVEQASAAMYEAQMLFSQSNYEVALNGDAKSIGFNDIISQYSGTEQANLAQHYAGMCNLYMGKFEAAIECFNKFDNVDGTLGEIVSAQNEGLKGDAYSELGNIEQALECYNSASSKFENLDTTPKYLHKAGGVYVKMGKYQEALDSYKKIKEYYPSSFLARDIDKYISYVEQKL